MRIILSIAALYDLDIWQMDVKIIFLNEELKETIFMAQPESYINEDSKDKVYGLKKSLYDQSSGTLFFTNQ